MKFSAVIVAIVAAVSVQAQELMPSCAAPCAYILERTGCGPLVPENVGCFCARKDAIYGDMQSCLMNDSGCTLRDMISIRQKIRSMC